MKIAVASLALALASAFAPVHAAPAATGSFADNPIVYFVVTDRFQNGNPANDHSYGRTGDGGKEIGTFHGGDLAGITAKLKEGWFKQLGVNAIWITAPYEQIHGWVVGGNKAFRHYAYHGYYALDYTVLDQNMGTPVELREMIDTAHAQGIRVLFDIVMNHPGYLDIKTAQDMKIPVLWKGADKATLDDYHSYIDYNAPRAQWAAWWGGEWVRAGLNGYTPEGGDDFTKQLAYLPDFKTESKDKVKLPQLLKNKADTRAKDLPDATVRDYLVTWLTDWVREYGVDGFRADTVKHVEPDSWRALKQRGTEALAAWKAANKDKAVDAAPFWMVGEYWGQDTRRTSIYDAGFDAMINFDFQQRLLQVSDYAALDALYSEYAGRLAGTPGYNVLSYLSSHDTELFPRKRLVEAGNGLLLAPGGVQIFYGDESARPLGPAVDSDAAQGTRSDMNWKSLDQAVLAHWRKLGQFRARHVALARGAHARISSDPYVFSRSHEASGDKVVVALGVKGAQSLPVGKAFKDGTTLVDAYSGREAQVKDGKVSVEAQGVVLLEQKP
ncbi:alpha-amylase family glycosyl hydrolase [Niveibacterium sp. SC-1]|uniref:alpha-amylase family glycosyl hydrolase n=1 Tax=Niveibacterium sp. SC-1 TaxID=3135646 RepID=UPI00311D73D3